MPRTASCSRLSTVPTSSKSAGQLPLTIQSHMANVTVVATQQVSRSWPIVGFSRRRAVDLPKLFQYCYTIRLRAPVAAFLTEHPSHPPYALYGQAFGGAGFRNRSLTRINLLHSLPGAPVGRSSLLVHCL